MDGQPFCFYCNEIADEDVALAENTMNLFKNMQFKKQLDSFQQHSLINNALRNASFDNYKPQSTEQAQAMQECKRYAEAFDLDKPQSLLLFGPFGTGKSHLAKSVTDIIMAKDHTCLFISFPKLLTKIKSTWKKDSDTSEFKLYEMLSKVDFLVLDDLGAERNSVIEDDANWAKPKFFEIVDGRAGKSTIITTNFDTKQAMRVYGERDLSRFLQDAAPIEVPGDNYRMRKFGKKR
jgi:DNA replication protein DnaC